MPSFSDEKVKVFWIPLGVLVRALVFQTEGHEFDPGKPLLTAKAVDRQPAVSCATLSLYLGPPCP